MKKASLVWIEGYSDIPLPYSQETVEKFAAGMEFAINDCEINKEGQVNEDLFKRKDGMEAPVDVARILYYAGHGSPEGPEFLDGEAASADEMELGSKTVIAVFDCCEVLSYCVPWESAFHGLRYMLGFTSSPRQCAKRGEYFAYRLRDGLVISEAWRRATTESGASSWCSLRAFLKDQPKENVWPPPDPLPNQGDVQFSCLAGSPELPLVTFSELAHLGHKAILFATPRPSPDQPSLEVLSNWFRMDSQGSVHRFGVKQTHSHDSSLEVFEESSSFWWNHKISQQTYPCKDNLPAPVPIDRLVNVASLLFQQAELRGYRLSNPWESFTTGSEKSQDGKSSVTCQVARHLEFPLTLDGFPLFGPGAYFRASVHQCELSEVVFFSRVAVKNGTVPIIGLSEAEALLKSDQSFMKVSSLVRVLRRSFGYYALPPRETQDHLIPVYAFEGVVTTKLLARYSFVRYVQAIPEGVRKNFPDNSVIRRLPPVFP